MADKEEIEIKFSATLKKKEEDKACICKLQS